ncbi:MAG: formimidoylglutamase [Crocinitomicaceae bacterium]|nr:formimidoylglutamase [Crocinitomicaceae bacterium]
MKDLSIFFQPIHFDASKDDLAKWKLEHQVCLHTALGFPLIENKGIAIFNVPEERGKTDIKEPFLEKNNNSWLTEFLNLYPGFNWHNQIYVLGDLLPGASLEDTYFALTEVTAELIKNNIIPFVIGGGQDLTYAMYRSYADLEQLVNLCAIDAKLDFGDAEAPINDNNWLSKIVLDKPCYLFNFSNIGAQSHFIPSKEILLFDELYFDITRLGLISNQLQMAEPILRNTDLLSCDLDVLRSSDWMGGQHASPNGLFAHELCQLIRYAGISDKLSAVGLFNYSKHCIRSSDNALIAQLIWYFIDGVENRQGDFPIGSKKNYFKYRVFMSELDEEILFLKSDKTGRWWMEVPYPPEIGRKYMRHQLVPCDYITYQEAMKGEIPDLWWRTYQKLG